MTLTFQSLACPTADAANVGSRFGRNPFNCPEATAFTRFLEMSDVTFIFEPVTFRTSQPTGRLLLKSQARWTYVWHCEQCHRPLLRWDSVRVIGWQFPAPGRQFFHLRPCRTAWSTPWSLQHRINHEFYTFHCYSDMSTKCVIVEWRVTVWDTDKAYYLVCAQVGLLLLI